MTIPKFPIPSTSIPIIVSPPAREIANCTFMKTHAGIYNACTKTIRRVIARAVSLKFEKTTSTSGIVANPASNIANPKTAPPDKSQRELRFASSKFPAPNVLPKITPVAVVTPPNETKNKFEIAKLAAIPATTSAPPRPL